MFSSSFFRFTPVVVAVFLFLLTSDALSRSSKWDDLKEIKGEVTSVVDGDTIKIKTKEVVEGVAEEKVYKVRLLGIDTPETNYMGQSQGHWGDQASQYLTNKLPIGQKVKIEFGVQKIDRYGRLLGHVWKGKTHVNRLVLSKGLAVNYCIYPEVKYCKDFALVTRDNISRKKGFYSDSDFVIPYEWRRVVSERPYEKYVGSLFTEIVYEPDQVETIPVSDRIFFFEREDVQPPFRLEDMIWFLLN